MSTTTTIPSVLPDLTTYLGKAPKLSNSVPQSPVGKQAASSEKTGTAATEKVEPVCRATHDYKIPGEDTKNYSVLLNKKEDLQMVEIPVPKPAKGEVQLQVKATGICGSDVHTWKHGAIGIFEVTEPIILGHESMGIVTEVGEGVTNLKVGDRVAIEAGIPCSECDQCLTGHYNLCPDVLFKSTPPHHGVLANYITHPARWLYKLPDTVSDEEGALLEPLSVAIAACERAGVRFGKSLLICGSGPIGLIVLAVARAIGVGPIIITDMQESRLEYARKMGADFTYKVDPTKKDVEVAKEIRAMMGTAPDYSLECTGVESSFRSAIMATRDGGCCCMVGVGKNDQLLPVNSFAMREVDIKGLFRYHHTYPTAISLIAGGKVDIKHLVTHRFDFKDSLQAFEIASDYRTGAIKVQIFN
ncbi:L-arabinitol 4-dehydrogenase [Umbelopsis sp. WA50703]